MKKAILCYLLAMLSISIYSQDALGYLKLINTQQQLISQSLWDYTCSSAQGKGARKVENKRKDLLNSIQAAKGIVEKMTPYNGGAQLRDSSIAYFSLSYDVINQDYAKIVDMQEISEQSYDAMEAYLLAQEKANEKLEKALDVFKNEYQQFAKDNNITLLEDDSDLSKKLQKAAEVYKYYNPIFLLSFKPYKQEIYLLDALNRKDINAIQQNKQTLLSFAQEALTKLKDLPAYDSDLSLKKAAIENVEFYIHEANKMDILGDFYMKDEAMKEAKKSFDAKKNNTQEDVDAYNKAIDDLNKSVAEFNKVNQELNNKRSELVSLWNNTCSDFTQKHIPKK